MTPKPEQIALERWEMEIKNPILRSLVALFLIVGVLGGGVLLVAGLGFLTALVFPWLYTFGGVYTFLDYLLMGVVTTWVLLLAFYIIGGIAASVANSLFASRNRG